MQRLTISCEERYLISQSIEECFPKELMFMMRLKIDLGINQEKDTWILSRLGFMGRCDQWNSGVQEFRT